MNVSYGHASVNIAAIYATARRFLITILHALSTLYLAQMTAKKVLNEKTFIGTRTNAQWDRLSAHLHMQVVISY